IIFLTAKALKEDKLTGFKVGCDDYITKPFSIEELLLRMRVFLKRKSVNTNDTDGNDRITLGKYTLEHANLILASPGKEQILTMTEADLLRLFFRNKNKVIKREDILIAVWGDDSLYLSRSLDVFISRLRKLLSDDKKISLKNMRSVGFVMRVNE
ncbi:MAG: response regulator transcription factor, partial [Bacteroidales bacterium]|nr:response regulator transcription factor [Bacteroidales bacterium]